MMGLKSRAIKIRGFLMKAWNLNRFRGFLMKAWNLNRFCAKCESIKNFCFVCLLLKAESPLTSQTLIHQMTHYKNI